MWQTDQLLDYLATHKDTLITYNSRNIKLAVHIAASYISEPQARIGTGDHFFLSNEATIPQNNRAVLNIAHIIKHIMTSATEAELAALYIIPRESVYIIIISEEMGYKQPPTTLQRDDEIAEVVIKGIVQQKRTK